MNKTQLSNMTSEKEVHKNSAVGYDVLENLFNEL